MELIVAPPAPPALLLSVVLAAPNPPAAHIEAPVPPHVVVLTEAPNIVAVPVVAGVVEAPKPTSPTLILTEEPATREVLPFAISA